MEDVWSDADLAVQREQQRTNVWRDAINGMWRLNIRPLSTPFLLFDLIKEHFHQPFSYVIAVRFVCASVYAPVCLFICVCVCVCSDKNSILEHEIPSWGERSSPSRHYITTLHHYMEIQLSTHYKKQKNYIRISPKKAGKKEFPPRRLLSGIMWVGSRLSLGRTRGINDGPYFRYAAKTVLWEEVDASRSVSHKDGMPSTLERETIGESWYRHWNHHLRITG